MLPTLMSVWFYYLDSTSWPGGRERNAFYSLAGAIENCVASIFSHKSRSASKAIVFSPTYTANPPIIVVIFFYLHIFCRDSSVIPHIRRKPAYLGSEGSDATGSDPPQASRDLSGVVHLPRISDSY